ncbi:hypothetical protein GCM10022280_05200 [Sphingomonas swuensis]|uniref:GlsB/YeaQ/YmgE family stress response membrane protein n=1 Tax=Sphingomonas swuensis TaxID=977800 RepID=A0ABP7SER2_9SPHN
MPLTWILLLLAGALLGWLVSVMVASSTPREVLTMVGLGIVGAVLGALLVTPILAGPVEPTGFSLPALLLSLLGAILLLAAGVLLRRLDLRRP